MIWRTLSFFAAIPLLGQNPVTDTVKSAYGRMKQNLIETAGAMPESGYTYRLTPEQRPFGEWLQHVAMGNYNFCGAMTGSPASEDRVKAAHEAKVKSEIQQELKASFDFCDVALKQMDDEKAVKEIESGGKKVTPVQPMIGLVASLNEHYGNLVGYMRSKGIVPPSTARSAGKK